MKKLREFLNDSDNEFIIRILLVVVGLIFGTLFILLSTIIKNEVATKAFIIFGYSTYFSFLAGAGLWYLIDNG